MAVLYFILLPALWFDIRLFRIPNRLIVTGMLIGFLYRLLYPGGIQVIYYLLSMAGMFLLLIPLFRLRAFGGGDVKLLSVCALIQGFECAFCITLYALLFGGILSVLYLVYHHFFSKQLAKCRHVIHFSIPIFLGAVAQHIWGGVLWQIGS